MRARLDSAEDNDVAEVAILAIISIYLQNEFNEGEPVAERRDVECYLFRVLATPAGHEMRW